MTIYSPRRKIKHSISFLMKVVVFVYASDFVALFEKKINISFE